MSTYVAIGTSPFVDVSVVSGPYRTQDKAIQAAARMDHLGYVTEVAECVRVEDLEPVTNDEGDDL